MRLKLSLNVACTIAEERGGFCLSDNYINNITPLKWRCSKGHDVAEHTLENARRIAHSRNGKCLSEKYINCMTALLWRCSKGHEWNAPLNLLWKCVKGHIWHATLNAIKIEIPGVQFVGINMKIYVVKLFLNIWDHLQVFRPDFLKIPKHPKGLELDIYYPGHDFAIEVQDPQHENSSIEIPIILSNNKHEINSRKNYAKRIRLPLGMFSIAKTVCSYSRASS
ncbi:unnamed protein product [Rhizophagus irregularis]|nr:unnamed protein product [Rhizophagus irregularis]